MKWIDIRERQPEFGQKCYVWCDFLNLEGEVMQYKPLPFIELEDWSIVVGRDLFHGKTGFLTDDVTHWMPAEEELMYTWWFGDTACYDTFRNNEVGN
jgi:hypothetical protein